MNKEFVPDEQALALKELGFNEPCFATYEFRKLCIGEFKNSLSFELCKKTEVFPAPTFSQAFRFFREKHNLCQCVTPSAEKKTIKYEFGIFEDGYCNLSQIKGGYATYEEAELACLIKLIEIVKTK